MNLLNTPMRVFKEARRKGDTATMERAMGYVGDFSDKAEEYKAEADKGMEEDAKEAREKAELQREEAVRKRREEREKLEAKMEESRNADTNTKTTNLGDQRRRKGAVEGQSGHGRCGSRDRCGKERCCKGTSDIYEGRGCSSYGAGNELFGVGVNNR